MPETKVRSGQLGTTLSSKTIDNTNTINTDLTKLAIAGGTNGQVLSTNGSSVLSWATAAGGGGGVYDVQTFNTSGTWTKPAGTLFVEIWVIGAGTGGASGRRGLSTTNRCGGAGGGGNTWACFKVSASTLGSTGTVTIGSGGLGGISVTTDNTNGNNGNSGGETRFVSGSYRTNYYNNNSFVQGGGTSTTSQPGRLTQNVMPWGMYLAYVPNFQTFAIEHGSGRTTTGSSTFIYFADQGNGFNSNLGGGGGGGAIANSNTSAEGGFSQNMSTDSELTTLYANGGSPSGTMNGQNAVSGMNWVLPVSTGGAGGAHNRFFNGGNGGNGVFGSGGGGGGASNNGFDSGAGGNGGNGCIVVISYG